MIEQVAVYFGEDKPSQQEIEQITQYPDIKIIQTGNTINFFHILFQHEQLLNTSLLNLNERWTIGKNHIYTI